MRLDKILANSGLGSRSQVKKYIRKGRVSFKGETLRKAKQQIRPKDIKYLEFDGQPINYSRYLYYAFNKPEGVLSTVEAHKAESIINYLPQMFQDKKIMPVGRLDKDTSGLLLLTNNGQLNHRLLSPKYKVSRVYFVEVTILDHAFNEEDIENLAQGVALNSEENVRPADLEILSDTKAKLTLYEGKYHEVKRIMHAIGKEVISLKRLAYGPIELGDLKPGDLRKLGNEEVEALFKEVNLDTTEL